MDIVPGATLMLCDDLEQATQREGKWYILMSTGLQKHSGIYVISRIGHVKADPYVIMLCRRAF